MSIPKIIHFCWLSGEPYPELVQHCINSWKKVLPDYEIVLWDAKRFDVNSVPWVKQACEAKKWAFAADYIRLYALYNYGGIYLDSDVEVLKSFNDLLELPYFFGREHYFDMIDASNTIEAATMGCEKGNPVIKLCLDFYQNRQFKKPNGELDMLILPYAMALVFSKYKLKNIASVKEFDSSADTICLLPMDYFSPKNTRTLKLDQTENTYSIHHFNGSWYTKAQRVHVQLRIKLCKHFGECFGEVLSTIAAVFIHCWYDGFIYTLKKIFSKMCEKIKSVVLPINSK